MRNHGYDMSDWISMTSYRCNYMPDQNSYLPYRGWSIYSHTKFTKVPVSHDDLPCTLSSLSFLSSILPSPKNTKLSHCSLSLHTMINSYPQVEHTTSTAYTEYCIIPRSTVSCSQPVSRQTMLYSILYIRTITS